MEEFQEQHAIPQQISAYEFRLVGDMTLKQFFQLAAGALVSLVLYASNLPALIKWPLILFSFLVGIAFAFFPLEDRPLAKWVLLFAKAIYSPTLYVWKRSDKIPVFFKPEEQQQMMEVPQVSDESPEDEIALQAQASAPAGHKQESVNALKGLEEGEKEFVANIEKAMSGDDKVEIPEIEAVETDKKGFDIDQQELETPQTPQQTERKVTPFETTQLGQNVQQAEFTPEASPPNPPTKPNIIVGQVLGADGEIIEGAILEINDEYGRPARALKTNKVGHFMIVTPLSEGKYHISTEKDGYKFDPVSVEVKGDVIPPIRIIGHKAGEEDVEENTMNSNNGKSTNENVVFSSN